MGNASELVIVEDAGKAQVVRFRTDSLLDPLEVEAISEHLRAAMAANATGNVVVALDTVTQLSSLMISALVSLREEARAKGGVVRLAAVPERVDYVLKLTHLDAAFPTHATVEDALAAC